MSNASDSKPLIPFTFGVELEFAFATNNDTAPEYFEALERNDSSGIKYTADKNNRGRPDEMKTLERIARILKEGGLSVKVLPQAKMGADYGVWQITLDLTARLVYPDTVNTYLPDELKILEDSLRSWTHEGVELVSRILEAPPVPPGVSQPESLLEVKNYLDALHDEPTMPFRIASDIPYTGLHVHIGICPINKQHIEIPLKVIQHLSFLVAQYEDVISCFHPFNRRGGCNTATSYAEQVSHMIDTNLCSFIELGHTCGKRPLIPSLTDVRDTLFSNDMTSKKLSELMSRECLTNKIDSRYKFVNFQNIGRRAKTTVEFRQHQGTLSPENVSQWVLFLTALMRLAEKRSQTQEGSAQGTPMTLYISAVSPLPKAKAEQLLGLLDLDTQARSYWLARFDRYKDVPDKFTALLTQNSCPMCDKPNNKRGMSNVDGALELKGKKGRRA